MSAEHFMKLVILVMHILLTMFYYLAKNTNDLGIMFDNQLLFNDHIAYIECRLIKSFFFLVITLVS